MVLPASWRWPGAILTSWSCIYSLNCSCHTRLFCVFWAKDREDRGVAADEPAVLEIEPGFSPQHAEPGRRLGLSRFRLWISADTRASRPGVYGGVVEMQLSASWTPSHGSFLERGYDFSRCFSPGTRTPAASRRTDHSVLGYSRSRKRRQLQKIRYQGTGPQGWLFSRCIDRELGPIPCVLFDWGYSFEVIGAIRYTCMEDVHHKSFGSGAVRGVHELCEDEVSVSSGGS